MKNVNIEPFSFMNFIYPFQFDRLTYKKHVEAMDGKTWEGKGKNRTIWKDESFPPEDLLPHVARYLNSPPGTVDTVHLWKMNLDFLSSINGLGGGINQNKISWSLVTPHKKLSFEIRAVHVCLFRIGVGFLTFKIQPLTTSLMEWMDFLHYFRFSRGQRETQLETKRVVKNGQETSYLPPFVTETAAPFVFNQIVSSILKSEDGLHDSASWWKDVFIPGQLLPYVGLFIKGRLTETDLDHLIYRLKNFYLSNQILAPLDDFNINTNSGILPYANHQWFFFSVEGGGFLGHNVPQTPFFSEALPNHLQNQYYLLYLLALHQRYSLNGFSDEIAENWLMEPPQDNEQRENTFERIRDAFLSFNARGYFAQVMQHEQHHACYCRWQEVLQISRLYQDIRTEVTDMYEYLMLKKSERLQQLAEADRLRAEQESRECQDREKAARERAEKLEKLLSLITWLFGLPLLALTFQLSAFGENFRYAITFALVSLVIGVLFYIILQRVSKKNT